MRGPLRLRVALIATVLVGGAFAAIFHGTVLNAGAAFPTSHAERMGTRYTSVPANVGAPPQVKEIPISAAIDAEAIWGAMGRDVAGHIWLGVSTRGEGASAHLLEYAPDSGVLVDRGDVVSALKQAGLHREGEGQIKLHSKIIQAADGYLYFASFDEEGESASRAVAPKWGSHLWRLWPESQRWEHLQTAPEGLVALTGNGNWIYALGYWDHILYQYDTRKRTWRQVRVGSVRGHVSRNIVADGRGHVYVPRAREWQPSEVGAHPGELFSVELVEFDADLREVGATPIKNYAGAAGRDSHGLTGLSYLADGSIVVSTDAGFLYRIKPADTGAAKVEALGAIHPRGGSYAGSLFPIDGKRYLAAVVTTRDAHDWVIYDLQTRKSSARVLPFDSRGMLLYGSSTRDNRGRFYLVGSQPKEANGNRPALLQVLLPN